MKTLRNRLTSGPLDAGQVIVMFAVGMLFFVSLIVVIGDNALVRWQARNLQNTADAAALAGAQELDGTAASEAPAIARAQEWASKNIDDASVTVQVLDNYTRVRVTATRNAGTLFGGALTLGDPNVTRVAAARIASVDILPCVVPMGVQQGFYQQGVATGDLVEIKVAVQSGDSGSNTGLLNLQSGNSATPIQYGSCNTLTDPVTTKPGGTIGDVNNGLEARLKAAMQNSCYSETQVLNDLDRCKPGLFSTGTQATAVMLLPVLMTNIEISGSTTYPLAQTPSGQTLLAYFWIDGNATYENPSLNNNNWKCIDGQNECVIRGKFLQDVPVDLTVYDGGDVTDYDPEALIKIVQMVE